MAETEKLTLICPRCGKELRCKAPSLPGNYSVICPDPDCKSKVGFRYPTKMEQSQREAKQDVKLGLLDNGSYCFKCGKDDCRQIVLVPAGMVRTGHNKVQCPKCKTPHEFDIEFPEENLLKCQTAGCDAMLMNPNRDDGIYSCRCEKCGQEYSMIVQEGKVVKLTMKTPPPPPPSRQFKMKLVLGSFLGRKEYILSKGIHYVGRADNENFSDFSIKDKYASSRSVRIDVNENGGNLVYRLTVERAMNPVYHNSRELTVGDIVYLAYGDTLKLGKTLIKVQKEDAKKT